MNIKLINSKVNTVLRTLPNLSIPVPIDEIAKSRGLKIVSYPLDGDVSGVLAIQNGEATIGLNQDENKARKRFTIAHELGHYELHRDKSDLFVDKQFIYRSKTSGESAETQLMEREANYFASAILMPSELVRKEVEKIDLSEEAIKKLAEKFDVSPMAMSIRISNLGYI